jgi:hypothetical protein
MTTPSLIREGWGGFVTLTNPSALQAPPLNRGGNILMINSLPDKGGLGWVCVQKSKIYIKVKKSFDYKK